MNDTDVKDQTEEQAKEVWDNASYIAYQEYLRKHIEKKKNSVGAGTPYET